MSKHKFLYQKFNISEKHSHEFSDLSKHKLYIKDLIYERNISLNLSVWVNASFILKIWHIRKTSFWISQFEWTQALYWRFDISERHFSEFFSSSKHKLYIRDLTYQRDTLLNSSVQANTSFISEIWYIREAFFWISDSSECLVKCSVKYLVECSMK